MGRHAAVATNHPDATSAGVTMLRAGGNAADAAAAIGVALGVVEPHMSGLGGDALFHFWRRSTARSAVYNGCGCAPFGTRPQVLNEISITGPQASSTPGFLDAIFAMHNENGILSWRQICEPAISLAEEGFAATDNFRRFVGTWKTKLQRNKMSAQTFLNAGEIPELGMLVRQPVLASTIKAIAASDADNFYRGTLAKTLVRDLHNAGIPLSAQDLAAFNVDKQEALRISYRGYEVLETGPNSVGIALLQMLKIIEHFDLRALDTGSDDLLHLLIESKKLAFRDMDRYVADPRYLEKSVAQLLSNSHIEACVAAISADHAADVPLATPERSDGSCTTYYCVVDAAGNAVSALQSLNNPFGSGITLEETGIVMNNRMANWHLDPRHPNNLLPGKRVRQTMNAPMILRGSEIWATFGTPGADSQLQVNFQTAVSLIDHQLSPQAIAEAPRWTSSQRGQQPLWPHGGADILTLEEGFPSSTISGLEKRGHTIKTIPVMEGPCSMGCIRVLDNGVRVAGSDPRWDGWATAY